MAALRFNRGQQSTRSNSVSFARDNANNPLATSSSAAASTSGSKTSDSMKFVQKYLDECRSFYSCIYCRTHLANHDELISRSFQGNRSRAYLFNSVINVSCGPSVQRELNTGSHSVADIFCTNCGTTIGWKYEKAFVDSQKYKEGKYIIELAHVVRENRHLELDKRDIFLGLVNEPQKQQQSSLLSANTTTIGTNHQGSLSPTSSSGQWSPGTSSSSSSSSPSPSSSSPSNNGAKTRPSCRYNSPNYQLNSNDQQQQRSCAAKALNEEGDDLDNDDIDDDEVLMFPFYDDLYGNRSSYSNLSTSRSYQKRLRHSLNPDAAPYNWKCARIGGVGVSSPSNVSLMATSSTPLQQPSLTSCTSSSIEIPVNQSSQVQSDNSGGAACYRHQLAASRRFFASPATNSTPSFPPQPSTSQAIATTSAAVKSAPVARPNTARNSSELNSNPVASSSSARAMDQPMEEDDGDTQFQFEHDKQTAGGERSLSGQHDRAGEACAKQPMDSQAQLGANLGISTSSNSSGSVVGGAHSLGTSGLRSVANENQKALVDEKSDETLDVSEMSAVQSMTRTNSLSFDDEEFYDCNTDHDVSNSSFRPK